MSEAYDGQQVVGMDLHRRRSVLVRMTADGRKLETVRITNSPAGLRRVIARAGKRPRVVLEAAYGWYWAAGTLAAAGAEVHLAHPLGVKAFAYRRVKNDEKDAADRADLLRMGRLPGGWIAPDEIRELREITRYRIKLVRLRTSCKDQVHAVLAKLGIEVTCSDIFGVAGPAWLDELPLPQPYAGKAASLRTLAGELTAEITLLEAAIAGLLAHHDGYHAIRALPGIGPVLAAVLVAEIGDITRFATPARLCSQAGADTAAPRIRYQGPPRAHHQTGVTAGAVGAGRGHPARARRPPPARAQGRHHRPPRRPGTQHRQGRRGPTAAHLGLLRDARRPGPIPGRCRAAGGVSRPGRGQRVTGGFTGPRPRARGRLSD
jgi:transposase